MEVSSIPQKMRAIILKENGAKPEVGMLSIPKPGPGEVLVKMHAAPINPSDLAFLIGRYGIKKAFPAVPGFEGSGTVVKAGKGILPKLWLGKRVACAASPKYNGSWAEYMLTSASLCVSLSKSTSFEQGASLFVNPLTALSFMEIHKKMSANSRKPIGIINTAAAGALGRMILKMCLGRKIPVISIVRRQEQIDLLKKDGAQYILNSEAPDFEKTLKDLARQLNTQLILDAVGGALTRKLLFAAPKKSKLLIYGRLSPDDCIIDPANMIFTGSQIEGFWLSQWAKERNFLQSLMTVRKVQSMIGNELKTVVNSIYPLESIHEALDAYVKNMSKGKVLIKL